MLAQIPEGHTLEAPVLGFNAWKEDEGASRSIRMCRDVYKEVSK